MEQRELFRTHTNYNLADFTPRKSRIFYPTNRFIQIHLHGQKIERNNVPKILVEDLAFFLSDIKFQYFIFFEIVFLITFLSKIFVCYVFPCISK